MTYEFGEFDSYKELNMAAEGQKDEGDIETLKKLAKENGIDEYDVEDYINGDVTELTTPLTAAYGKLDIESEELNVDEIMQDWVDYIRLRCAEDELMALAVKKKSKSLKGCIGALLKWSFANAKPVDKDVMTAAGVSQNCKLGIPGMLRAKEIITKYYMEG